MRIFAKFEIIGRIGSIDGKDRVMLVTLAASGRLRDSGHERDSGRSFIADLLVDEFDLPAGVTTVD